MNPKKITVAMAAGGLTTGGVESVVYSYVSHMPADVYNWIYISYDTPDEEVKKRFEAIGFRVYAVTKKKDNFFKSCAEVLRIFRDNQVTVVHSHMTLMCFVTNLLGRMAGASVLISHSHLFLFPSAVKRPVYAIFKRLSRWTATDLFACGKDAAVYLFGRRAFERGRVYLMNNAIDVSRYTFSEEKREALRNELGLSGMTVIGHVGRFTEQKNHRFLLRIFAEYQKGSSDSRLLLAGDGPLMNEIKAEAKSLGIAEKVIFYGPTDQMQALYSAMDFFLFPSVYEGFGIAVIEAQTAGLRVLASDRVAPEAALDENVRFLSVEESEGIWAEEMRHMLAEKKEREAPRAVLRERGLDIETEAAKMDVYYRQAVGRKNR